MKQRDSTSVLATAVIAVALICTFVASGGWLVWLAVLPALLVVAATRRAMR